MWTDYEGQNFNCGMVQRSSLAQPPTVNSSLIPLKPSLFITGRYQRQNLDVVWLCSLVIEMMGYSAGFCHGQVRAQGIVAYLMLAMLLWSGMASCWTCYKPGGTDRNPPNSTAETATYRPCDARDGVVSMCCATWDTCMPGGLCWNEAYQIWWREACTDPEFRDPNCVKLFLDVQTGRAYISSIEPVDFLP